MFLPGLAHGCAGCGLAADFFVSPPRVVVLASCKVYMLPICKVEPQRHEVRCAEPQMVLKVSYAPILLTLILNAPEHTMYNTM